MPKSIFLAVLSSWFKFFDNRFQNPKSAFFWAISQIDLHCLKIKIQNLYWCYLYYILEIFGKSLLIVSQYYIAILYPFPVSRKHCIRQWDMGLFKNHITHPKGGRGQPRVWERHETGGVGVTSMREKKIAHLIYEFL